jgi:hypothetical protein
VTNRGLDGPFRLLALSLARLSRTGTAASFGDFLWPVR